MKVSNKLPGNPHLFTPKDFDFSPYFEIIKYPMTLSKSKIYQNWPWEIK